MPKETKFTLALLLFLGVAFGFVVWQRVAQQGDVIASLKEKAKNMMGQKDHSKKNESDLHAGHHNGSHQTGTHQNEPRRLPFDSGQTTQVAPEPFNNHHQNGRNHDHGQSHRQHQRPTNPFAQNESTFVAKKPPEDLFAKPTTQQNQQAASKPDPFSPWTSREPKKGNPFAQNNNTQQKPINAFPASQTRTHTNVGKNSSVPDNPFFNAFPTKKQEEAPKPNPFARGHKIDNNSHAADNHSQNKTKNNPFNPFDSNTKNTQQNSGTASLHSGNTPAKKNPFDPFQPVKQTSQQSQNSQSQQPFDPFGSVSTNQSHQQNGFRAPGLDQHSHHHNDNTNQHQHGRRNSFDSPRNHLPVESKTPTRVYTVKPDESYWSISKKVYGTIRYFQALEEHNRSRIASAKKLRPGMKVLVPEEKILLASYTKLIPGAGKSSDSSQSEQNTQGLFFTSSGQPMFRISEEDTLGEIALRHLGRTTRWVEIYNLNRDRIKTPDRLKIGIVLRLPADASRIALAPGSAIRR